MWNFCQQTKNQAGKKIRPKRTMLFQSLVSVKIDSPLSLYNILKSWRWFWQEWVTVTLSWHCHLLIQGAGKLSTGVLGTMNNDWLVRKRKLRMKDEFLFVKFKRWLCLMLKDFKDFKSGLQQHFRFLDILFITNFSLSLSL